MSKTNLSEDQIAMAQMIGEAMRMRDQATHLFNALLPFAGIKADDGDDFDTFDDIVIVRIEASAGEIRRARLAVERARIAGLAPAGKSDHPEGSNVADEKG